MPRRPTERQLYDELLDRYGKAVADAFQAAIDDLKRGAELQRLTAAIQAGDIDAAVSALHLDPAVYGPMLDTLAQAYGESGRTATDYMRTQAVIRFNARNRRAEAWLRDHSAELVTRVTDQQRQAIREHLVAGMERGDNPTRTALSIVGRVDKATGKRQGGVIGLTPQQAGYVRSVGLELSGGDPAALRNYLTRKLRDRRFDGTVRRAIEAETPVQADIARKAVTAYERRLLKLRGDMIGRTESLAALNAARHQAYQQAVESGAVDAATIRRTWRSAGDFRVRHSHQALNGDSVGFYEPFRSPTGARMMFPGDTSMGAGPEELANCRCVAAYRIDFLANIR